LLQTIFYISILLWNGLNFCLIYTENTQNLWQLLKKRKRGNQSENEKPKILTKLSLFEVIGSYLYLFQIPVVISHKFSVIYTYILLSASANKPLWAFYFWLK